MRTNNRRSREQSTANRRKKKPRSNNKKDNDDASYSAASLSVNPMADLGAVLSAPSLFAAAAMSSNNIPQNGYAAAAQDARRDEIMKLARHELWSDNADVLLDALEQFAEFCEPENAQGEACRQALFAAGVHAVIVHRLATIFVQNEAVQGKGLEVLFHLSSSPVEMIEDALLHIGAVPVAVSAMTRFPGDADIQIFSCVLVGNLVNSLSGWDRIVQQAAEVKQALAEAAAAPPLLPAAAAAADENQETNDIQDAIENQEINEQPNADEKSNAPAEDDDNNGDNHNSNDAEETGSVPHETNENSDAPPPPPATPPPSAAHLLSAVQEAQQRHFDNEKIQEAVSFLLERCLNVAGSLMLGQLIASAPHCVNGLLLAKQKFANNPGISLRVKAFFQKLVSISEDASTY